MEQFNWKAIIIIDTSSSEIIRRNQEVRQWYFMKVRNHHWSFQFRTKFPDKLVQNIETEIECRFLAEDSEIQKIPINSEYEMLSGLKAIGKITLIGPV